MNNLSIRPLSLLIRRVTALVLGCFFLAPAFGQLSISGIINTYTQVTGIYQPGCNACDLGCINTITLSSTAGFNAGDKLLIIQMKGATIDVTNTAAAGAITAIGNAGNYEFFEIADVTGNVITPRYPLIRTYDVAGVVQVVKIPQYNQHVIVTDTLKALDWNDAVGTGGVIALYARKLTLNAPIYVLGAGYRGESMAFNGTPDNCTVDPNTQWTLPNTNNTSYNKGQGIVVNNLANNRGRGPRGNGGGSGGSGDTGGGGGSNYGAGGNGGWRWCDVNGADAGGRGGASLVPYLAQDRVFLGGAGGPGWVSTGNPSLASDGGGIVIIFADTLVGNNKNIVASGTNGRAINPVGAPDGGGGGGAGGTIVLKVPVYQGTTNLFANGGDGQDLNTNIYHGPGGGGGGGAILYSLSTLPSNVNLTVAGGAGGQHLDGTRNQSIDGSNGGTISLYVPIQNPSYEFALDNDGIQNLCDIDDDNDGILDVREAYVGDHDTDGTPDWSDPEFCAATFQGVNGWDCTTMGLPDPGGDMDGDSRPNFQDPNFPYCGTLLTGSICSGLDADRDAVPNHLDLDADNDGITDIIESGGIDVDGNGFADISGDDDADGLVNIYDPTCTGAVVSGRGTAVIATGGTVTNLANVVDTDNATFGSLSASGSSFDIALQQALPAGTTIQVRLARQGGAANATGNILSSFDGAAFVNSQAYSVNGTPTNINYTLTATTRVIRVITTNAEVTGVYIVSYTYTSCSGLPGNLLLTQNSDADNIPNFLDRDSDNDGIPDVIEAGGIDSDGDGQTDNMQDTDEDGYADHFDPDNDGTAGVESATDPLVRTTADIGSDGFSNDGETLTEGDGTTSQDTDGDGFYDWLEIDSDNDGITDIIEVGDTDANQDGLIDGYTDADRDGYSDNNDPDDDGTLGIDTGEAGEPSITSGIDIGVDGKSNDNEGFSSPVGFAVNPDNGNEPNFQDIDADDDGLVDNNEAQATASYITPSGTDSDNDGLDNAYDPSSGGSYRTPVNTESTGFPDYLDLTTEDDNQSDIIEGHDSDNNGIPDAGSPARDGVPTGVDSDRDGLDDGYDNAIGIFNPTNGTGALHMTNGLTPSSYPNLDVVGTPERDWREGIRDNDADGISDANDLDDDNDGIPDVQEACGTAATNYSCYAATLNNGAGVGLDPMGDEDGDEIPNYVDKTDNDGGGDFVNTCTDANADGVCDQTAIFPAFDKDLDGILNQFDLDADNDGLTDIFEAGGVDANGDGRVDVFTDADNDGWADLHDNTSGSVTSGTPLPLTNSDGDGQPNYLDLDSDNDGLPDLIEAGGTDTNGDGQVDDNGGANGDNDGDGYADLYDSDDDGFAGIDTGEETQPLVRTGTDIGGDGRNDDGEGTFAGNGTTSQDSDGDGRVDWLDLDSDNDGITDITEAGGSDANGDGRGDITTDTDNDGFFDAYDPDDDGFTGVDPGESGNPMVRTTSDNGTIDGKVNGTESYTEGDGITSQDTDGDLIADWLDLDNDNDGMGDIAEVFGSDIDGDGRVDTYTDADGDGYADLYDSDDDGAAGVEDANDPLVRATTDANTDGKVGGTESFVRGDGTTSLSNDGDRIPNWLDLDSDDDGITDILEAGGTDTNGDGRADTYTDADSDGYTDQYDSDDDNAAGIDDPTNPLVRTTADANANGKVDGTDSWVKGDGTTSLNGDRDSRPNWLDLDADNDGLTDLIESGGADSDGDGRINWATTVDNDNDGYGDVFDSDDDNVAGVDAGEATQPLMRSGADSNGNGKIDGSELYTEGNGTTNQDSDADLIPDFLDLDADNDGLTDIAEAGGIDTDGDGRVDTAADADNDGYADIYDSDDDGTSGVDAGEAAQPLAMTSADVNNNGKPDGAETLTTGAGITLDFDGDAIAGFLDLDSDNDGLTDLLEAGGIDTDGDGRADGYTDADNDGYADRYDSDDDNAAGIDDTTDPLIRTAADNGAGGGTASDGKVNGTEAYTEGNGTTNQDSDGDRLPDFLDLDSDADGTTDVIESGQADANTDGRIDGYTDGDGDGYSDTVDPDDDGVAGVDAGEATQPVVLTAADINADGKADDGEAFTSPSGFPVNGDSDRFPNFVDIDADNDGIVDNIEARSTAAYQAPAGTDTDADGLDNNYDPTNGGTYIVPVNTEGTGYADYLDLNTDDDSQSDVIEGHDSDNNGTADAGSNALNGVPTGADTDNDGLDDGYDNAIGTWNPTNGTTPTSYFLLDGGADRDWRSPGILNNDGDGFSNTVDLDDDNDGLTDVRETCGTAATAYTCLNTILHNGGTGIDPTADNDGDGRPNYVDSTPGGGATNTCTDANADGICDAINPIFDKDGDGVPNFFDRDSDDDGITDVIENGLTDSDGNGVVDYTTDSNGNGVVDLFDATCNGGTGTRQADFVNGTSGTIANQANAVDTDNATYAEIQTQNGYIDLRLQDIVPNGTTITVRLARVGGTQATTGEVLGSADGITYTNLAGTQPYSANNTVTNYTYTTNLASTRYIRVTRTHAIRIAGVYIVTYTGVVCGGTLGTAASPTDRDGDSYPDYLDLDADNDGLTDLTEAGGTDTNGDGKVDNRTDSDQDGYADLFDSDDDGTTGIDAGEATQPLVRSTADVGGDGFANDGETYTEGNGTTSQDADGDTRPDYLDLDADNDGIADIAEAGGTDTNGDGKVDVTTDADNDGYADIYDSDDDGTSGVEDATDPLIRTTADANTNGKVDNAETFTEGNGTTNQDSDLDGRPDFIDLDADNDGLTDLAEAGGTDTDGDGKVDVATDADTDGYADVYDSDDDGAAGVEDTTDPLVRTTADANTNGKVDNAESFTEGNGTTNQDTDRDGKPDFIDLDADNDGITDLIEAFGIDVDGDGKVDVATDGDNDGYADLYDSDDDGVAGVDAGEATQPLVRASTDGNTNGKVDAAERFNQGDGATNQDSDRDGRPDFLDLDSDNDGITDLIEAGGIDSDGQGTVEITTDADNDGYADVYDSDDNNDGTIEGTTQPLVRTFGDTGSDGKLNGADIRTEGNGSTRQDVDNDGRNDWLDLDADNDGIPDLVEVGGADDNNDGLVDITTDTDLDGYADIYDSDDDGTTGVDAGETLQPIVMSRADGNADGKVTAGDGTAATWYPLEASSDQNPADTDKDGIINAYDADADGDGITDPMDINGGTMPAGFTSQGIVTTLVDANNNGWQDALEGASVILDPNTDSDADGIADQGYATDDNLDTDRQANAYDIDADNDGILDVDEAQLSNSTSLPTGLDSDNDGIDNAFDPDNGGTPVTTPANIDAVAGTPDYLDLDTDDDGSRDWVEGFDGNDANVDALSEYIAKMSDWRSVNCPAAVAQCAVYDNTVNADGDGYPAWCDANDAVPNANNGANFIPPFLDAANPTYYFDTDRDGLVDIFDLPTGGASTEPAGGVSSVSAQAPAASTALTPDYRNAVTAVTFPVEWASFEARAAGRDARLDWSTASELNNDHFVVERSVDGSAFVTVGKVAATPAAANGSDYAFTDPNVAPMGTLWYRLQQVDINGNGSYSETRSVTFANDMSLTLLPNPASKVCSASITLPLSVKAEVRIVDMLGQVKFSTAIDGNTQLSLDLTELAVGVYVVEVAAPNQSVSARLIVQ